MPEGPEIRRAADRIARAIQGKEATRVYFAFPRLKKYQRILTGKRVEAVETRGKAMLIRFENDLNVYAHSQLYGRWYVKPAGKVPVTGRSLRLGIHNHERSALLYSASEIDVLPTSKLGEHAFLSKLGPDALDPELTDAALARWIGDKRFARRQLHALLLDQGFVAGIGNYLRSEILFVARIHPTSRLADLDRNAIRRLARVIRRVTRRAYETGGVTNDPKRVKKLKAEGHRRREYRHFVFTRGGRSCYECGGGVKREELGSRKIFFCPRCQPVPA